MTISTRAQLAVAERVPLAISKGGLGSLTTGSYGSYWRGGSGTSLPPQGAIPGAAAIPDRTTTGALFFENPISGKRTYLTRTNLIVNNFGGEVMIADRLAHMGGLDGTSLVAQTVSLDASVSTSNLAARRGATDYSDVLWFLEWYTTTGAVAVNASVAVTYNDASTDTIVVALATNMATGRMLPILPNAAGKYIKSVQSVTLSLTTGTAGSFGVTALRMLGNHSVKVLTNIPVIEDWPYVLIRIENDACLFLMTVLPSTASSTVSGGIVLLQG